MTVATAPTVLTIVYDLAVPGAWDAACQHAELWGRLYTDIHTLDADHIAVSFHAAPDRRWQVWEAERLRWLEEELAA